MNRFQKWKTQWSHWEFWPFWFFYIPLYFYFVWLSIRERSFFFFTATNPHMEFGGMIGEKKSEILRSIPEKYYAKTILVTHENLAHVEELAEGLKYPIIAKPNIGERGNGVEKIHHADALHAYVEKCNADFLLQDFIDYPIELGVFYVRHPSDEKGKVTSIVSKEFLSVKGDGILPVESLIQDSVRGSLQADFSHNRFKELMPLIPKKNEVVIIEEIGNHCRGTKFLDSTNEIDSELELAIDRLAKEIPEFYYGRFDLKCKSFDDLRKLQNFKILELNGVGAEPAHIYQPGYSLSQAYRTVFWHFNQMALIAQENKKRGISFWTHRQGIKKLFDIRAYNRHTTLP